MFRHNHLSVLAALTMLLSLGSLVLLVNTNEMQQTDLLEESALRGLERSLAREQEYLDSVTRDFAWWDDTIRFSLVTPDDDWAQQHFGHYLKQSFNIQYSALLGPDLTLLHQYSNQQPDLRTLALSPDLKAQLQSLQSPQVKDKPVSFSGLGLLHGEVMLISAATLTQEAAAFHPTQYQNHLLLTARPLEGDLLAQLTYTLNLDALRLETAPEHKKPHGHALALHSFSGEPLGDLHLELPMPDSGIHNAMLITFVILAAVSILTLYLTWHISRLLASKQRTNQQLTDEVDHRKRAQQALYDLQDKLQQQVEERTEQLKLEREQLSSIFDASADGIITIDNQSTIETVNPAAARMFGYTPEELIGEKVEMLLTRDERQRHQTYVNGSRLHAPRIINKTRQLWAHHKDGHSFPIDLNVAPVRGTERRFVGVMRDISERVELERGREEAISELRNVLETAAEGYVRIGLQGEILEVNEAFCKMMGQRRQVLLQKKLGELVTDEHRPLYDQQISSRDVHLQRSYELSMNTADGVGHYAVKATTVLDRNGMMEGSFAFVADMTEIRHYQQVLERTRDEAERANRAKSEFLSSMSHELRTPLNAILGFAQLLSNSRREPLSERQQTQMKHIIKGGQHLLTLINEVLDLARIEAGRMTLSLEPVAPIAVINECLALLQGTADDRDVVLHAPSEAYALPMIRADRTRFRQTLLNLLSNAIKYNQPAGSVSVEISQRDNNLRFAISDTGMGIEHHRQQDLFKPFSRLGNEKSDIEGTGIGLTITRQLVELMDGEIGFDSVYGEGSTFWFTLPLAAPDSEIRPLPAQATTLEISEHPHQTILYIEDNPANQQLMQQLLEEVSSYNLLLCHNAELGIELAQQHQPDLILMDLNLPGISGFDAIEQLKAQPVTRNIPVVAISANAMDSVQRRAREAGFEEYLTKPIELGQVMHVLENYLAEERVELTE